jgi:hypothetical protein
MDRSHPLNLNLQKVASCLSGVLLPAEIEKITAELHRNVRHALRLSEGHLRFARAAKNHGLGAWRQVVSRGYYCCYCASRATRLAKTGVFSMEADDHKRIGDLPDGFPSRAVWADILTKFRADRNLADYDHSARGGALEYSAGEYLAHASSFLKEVKQYLRSEGIL